MNDEYRTYKATLAAPVELRLAVYARARSSGEASDLAYRAARDAHVTQWTLQTDDLLSDIDLIGVEELSDG